MQKFNIIKCEDKNENVALKKCLEDLNLEKNEVFFKSEFVEGSLFKGSKYIVSVLPKSEVISYINDYIMNLGNFMNIKIETEIKELDNSFNVILISDNNAILIGKEGKTLNAIQTLIRQALKVQINLNLKINIDVANYKVKKLKNIESQVKKIAEDVINTKITAALDPMNSYERRFVHNLINSYSNLETESIGEGKDRRITIKYIGD